jgi:methylglutaconyl-CoA hydratase
MTATPVHQPSGVTVEHVESVTTITLDAAHRANAITVAAMQALLAGLEQAHERAALLLVIQATGADFTTGRDQSEQNTGLTRLESLGLILRANELLTSFGGVSISLIQGRAFGFGSGLAVQSDITVATDDAVFGFNEVRHGLAPLVVAEYLPRYVGPKVAGELIFTGRTLPASEALALRLINRVVPKDGLVGAGQELVAQLAGLEPGALRLMKRYNLAMQTGTLTDPQQQAIEWLDDWLSAGRPNQP